MLRYPCQYERQATDSLRRLASDDKIKALSATRLLPTSVAVLHTKPSKRSYVDVAFNPLYNRQIATIDERGDWCIWENENRHGKHRTPKLNAIENKSANILTDYDPDPGLRIPKYAYDDGWYKVIWIRDLTTIAVCSRTHLAVFDFQGPQPARLDSSEFMVAKGMEIIRDIKRSTQRLDHCYVLTSSKIYWIEVTDVIKHNNVVDAPNGVKVLQSYRHFRNVNDETLQLATLFSDYSKQSYSYSKFRRILTLAESVFVHSENSSLVNFYRFRAASDGEDNLYSSSQGTFAVATDHSSEASDEKNLVQHPSKIRGVCWHSNVFEVRGDEGKS